MNPTQKEINIILATAKAASKNAGDYLLKHFGRNNIHDYEYKEHHEIVTKRDLAANKIIVKSIKEKFSGHNIISEEIKYKKTDSPYTWYVDPLDGTTNYTASIPLFAVNIGIALNATPIVGVIYLPYTKEHYWATLGQGAYCNNKEIKVSKVRTMKESFIQLCHAYEKENRLAGAEIVAKITGKCRVYRRFGCAGFEHTNVARGRAEATAIMGSRSWDNLAGALIIEEAGGQISDAQGNPWKPTSKTFVASNGQIHFQFLQSIK